MATADYVLANASGAAFRTDLNNTLAAIVSNNSNSSEPATKYAYQWWADTSASIFKIRNSSNDGWINLFTLAGGIDVDAASNFNEDVTFTGASANIVFDKSDNALEFADNAKAVFGSGGDLEITHGGSNSAIAEVGTGNLEIKTNSSILLQKGDSEFLAKFISDGAVELYYDGTKHLETNANGILLGDSILAQFGVGTDLEIFHNGTDSVIDNVTGELKITTDGIMRLNATEYKFNNAANTQIVARFVEGGTNELYFDHSNKLQTYTAGVDFFGDVRLGDNYVVRLGNATGGDLKFYHDSSNSYIQHGTVGNLRYQSNNHDFYNQAGNEFMCRMFSNDAVNLYFDHTARLETTSAGIIVNGKYQQETAGGTHVYAQQIFRESIAANATKTFTITGLAYGNVKITMGFGDGNFHYATFVAVLGGNMYQTSSYNVNVIQNERSGVNSITATKNNTSYAIAIHAGTNQIFGSVVMESNNYDTNSGATLTIS